MRNFRRSLFACVAAALVAGVHTAWAEPADDQYAVAAGHYAQSRWELAVEEFDRFLKDHGGHDRQAQAHFYLAEALMQVERYDEARPHYRALVEHDPKHRYAAQAHFRSAEACYLARHADDARRELMAFVELCPDDKLAGNAFWYLGTLALDSHDDATAERWFRRGLERFSEGRIGDELRIGLSRALEQLGNQAEATKTLLELTVQPDHPQADEARVLLARLQYRAEKPADALATLEPLDRPEVAESFKHQAQLLRGCCQFRLDHPDDARQTLSPLFESEHVGIEARYWFGVTQQASEQWSEAAETFRAAAERAPYHVLAPALHYYAGDALLLAGNPTGADEQFEIVLDRWAKSDWADEAAAGRVRAAHARGDHAAVEQLGAQFVENWPTSDHRSDVDAWRARSLLAQGRAAEAVALLEPTCADQTAASPVAAVEAAEPVVPSEPTASTDPATPVATTSTAAPAEPTATTPAVPSTTNTAEKRPAAAPRVANRLLYAAALERAGRFADALAVADELLEASTAMSTDAKHDAESDDTSKALRGEALATRAQALAGLQRWDEAIAAFGQYIEQFPEGPRVSFCRGERAVALARNARFDDARQEYDAFIKAVGADRPAENSVSERLASLTSGTANDAWSSTLYARLADKENPPDVAARGLWGQARNAYRASRWQEAAQLLAEFLSRFENHANAADALLLRGTALEKVDDHTGAAQAFRELAERFPNSDQASNGLLAAARLLNRKQQKEEAATFYKRLVDEHLDEEHADVALFELSWVLRDLGQAEEADARLATLRERFPASPYADDATYRLAERAYRAGDFARAEELTTVLLAERTADGIAGPLTPKLAPYAWYLAGQVAAAQERWPQVAERMARVQSLKPSGGLALLADYWEAEALYRQNKFAEAAARLAELAPRIEGRRESWAAVAALRRAQANAQLKNWDAAESLARRIAVDFPQFNQQYEVDYLLGRSLASRGLFQQAREAYRRVIDSPAAGKTETVAMAQWMTGETYFHQQDYRPAIREYLRGETLYAYPEWQAASLLQAGKCHEALEQWDEAIKLYEQLGKQYSATTHTTEAAERLIGARAQMAKSQAARPAKPAANPKR